MSHLGNETQSVRRVCEQLRADVESQSRLWNEASDAVISELAWRQRHWNATATARLHKHVIFSSYSHLHFHHRLHLHLHPHPHPHAHPIHIPISISTSIPISIPVYPSSTIHKFITASILPIPRYTSYHH